MLPPQTKRESTGPKAERQLAKTTEFPTLQLLRNGSTAQEISLDGPRLLIGRSDDNDISIPSSYVSQHHILLLRHLDSTILIDLNSTNGTFVNSKRVYTHIMTDGDLISVDRRSMFVKYSVQYTDPTATLVGRLGDIEDIDTVIAKARYDVAKLLGKSDTDFLPTLRENEPTTVGFIDDR